MCRDDDAGLHELSVEELREERSDLRRTEARLSYERRLVQGRLDVLRSAILQRAEQDQGASDLAQRLAVALTDRQRDPGGEATEVTTLRVDVPEGSEGHFDEDPADLSGLDLEQMDALAARLEERERDLSLRRRELFEALDRLVAELADRYRNEDIPVAKLLGS